MKQARIEVDVASLGRSPAGSVHGKLLLQVDGVIFPHPEWTDFVVVILSWWCDAVLRLLEGEPGPIEVRFMEGPFLTELRSMPTQCWHVALIEDGLRKHVRYSADVDGGSLVHSLLSASETILNACQTRGWWSSDTDNLLSASAGLRKHRKSVIH